MRQTVRWQGYGGLSMIALAALGGFPSAAQTVTITSPTNGAMWTDWSGSSFSVSLSSLPNAERVCYTVDAYSAANLGQGPMSNVGCSNRPPYSLAANSYLWANGPHQVVATVYDALGKVIAKSGATALTIGNAWPCTWVPALSVTPGTPFILKWSGQVSLSLTLTGTGVGTDTFNYQTYIDGIQQTGSISGSGSFSTTLDTTQFPDGTHVIAATVTDNTGCQVEGQRVPIAEFSRNVVVANGSSTAMEVRTNAHETYLAPTHTATITPTLYNTDQSVNTSVTTFDFLSLNTAVCTFRTATGSSSVVTALAIGSCPTEIMAEAFTASDLVYNSSRTTVSSGTYEFKYSDVGKYVHINGGSGWTTGFYKITGVYAQGIFGLNSEAIVSDAPAAGGATKGHFAIGPARLAWVLVNSSNTLPHFGNDGLIHLSYVAGVSQYMHEQFGSSAFLTEQPYSPGFGADWTNSGFNTLEWGITTLTGTENQSTFAAIQSSYISSVLSSSSAACSKTNGTCMNFGTGDGIDRQGSALYNFTQGGCQNWTPLSCIGMVFSSLGSSFWGVSYEDEINTNGTAPLQGSLRPSASGTVQNWLQQIVCSSGICNVTAFSTTPGGFWTVTQNRFIIRGSATSGMNTPVGTILVANPVDNMHFAFSCAACPNGTYNSSNDPRLTIEPFVNQWFGSRYIPYTAFATMRDQSISYSASHVPVAGSQAAQTNLFALACWEGGTAVCPQSLTNPVSGNTVSSMADWADIYSSHSLAEQYLISRISAHPYITDSQSEAAGNELAWWLRTAYGSFDPGKPLSTITQGTNKLYDPSTGFSVAVTSMSGSTITTASPHRISTVLPGITRVAMTGSSNSACNTNYYVVTAPTSNTLTVVLAATNFTGAISSGTLTFANGNTLTVSSATATATTNPAGGDALNYAGSPNDSVMRNRGQTFTLAGTGNTNFNTNTFFFSPENLSLAQDANGTAVPTFHFRQVPNCAATGGTITIFYDNTSIRGRNVGAEGISGSSTPQVAALSVVEAAILRTAAERFYNALPSLDGYVDHVQTAYGQLLKGGFLGTWGPYYNTRFSPTGLFQLFANPHYENAGAVPLWHAASIAALAVTRNQDLMLQPTCSTTPDYGFAMDATARCGPNGNILIAVNGSDGPETRKFLLSPYLQSGQAIVRYVVNWLGVATTILGAGTTYDTLTLQPEDSVFYAFPATFAGRIGLPIISANLADVPNATQIVVRYGYDLYTLDSGNFVQGCGTGSCTLNLDLGIGQPGAHYYRIIYLGANGAVLATSDVQNL